MIDAINIFTLNDKFLFHASRTEFVIAWAYFKDLYCLHVFPCMSVDACCIQAPRLGRRGRGQADLASLPGTPARLAAFICLQKQTAQLAGVCCTLGTSSASRWGGRTLMPHPCSKLRPQNVSVQRKKRPLGRGQATKLSWNHRMSWVGGIHKNH